MTKGQEAALRLSERRVRARLDITALIEAVERLEDELEQLREENRELRVLVERRSA